MRALVLVTLGAAGYLVGLAVGAMVFAGRAGIRFALPRVLAWVRRAAAPGSL